MLFSFALPSDNVTGLVSYMLHAAMKPVKVVT
jgi:hypothetical protein